MIPSFIEIEHIGYLPEGIYECTLEELESNFGKSNFKRKMLFAKLLEFIQNVKTIGCDTLFIDGSYTTSKALPQDIDILWDFEKLDYERFNWNQIELNMPILEDSEKLKLKYEMSILCAKQIHNYTKKDFLEYFQFDDRTNIRKGILKIKL